MAFSHYVDDDRQLVFTTLAGTVNGTELVEAYRMLHTELDVQPNYHLVWDCRFIEMLDIDLSALENIKEAADEFCPIDDGTLGKFVVIAPRMLVHSGALAMVHFTRSRHRKKHVCKEIDEALDVLGLDSLPASMNRPYCLSHTVC